MTENNTPPSEPADPPAAATPGTAQRDAPGPAPATIPGVRTFSLKDPDAYAILCPHPDQPWIMAGSLPRAPRQWNLPTVPTAWWDAPANKPRR